MKVRVTVGPVEIRIDGLDITERQVRRLLDQAGQIAGSLLDNSPEPAEEERPAVGFTAHIERAPDLRPESYFTDDEE
jgi:hypothetical protein